VRVIVCALSACVRVRPTATTATTATAATAAVHPRAPPCTRTPNTNTIAVTTTNSAAAAASTTTTTTTTTTDMAKGHSDCDHRHEHLVVLWCLKVKTNIAQHARSKRAGFEARNLSMSDGQETWFRVSAGVMCNCVNEQ
jgi:hypothetical protein